LIILLLKIISHALSEDASCCTHMVGLAKLREFILVPKNSPFTAEAEDIKSNSPDKRLRR
jgi:hypothetical protein